MSQDKYYSITDTTVAYKLITPEKDVSYKNLMPSDKTEYEFTTTEQPNVHTEVVYPPVDGTYAWVIVVCAALNTTCTLGIANSFGVFSTYYLNYIYPNDSAAKIAWIGTTISLFMFGGSFVTGPLTDKFGFRLVALAGTSMCTLGLLLSSFTGAVWQLIITQGIMFGVGAACIYSPSISLPAQWHKKTRAVATGIVAAGGGAGGMIFTEVIQNLIEKIGYRWTLRVLALIILSIGGTAGSFFKRRVPIPHGGIDFKGILMDSRMVATGCASFFVNISYFIPFYYLPTAALKIGQPKQAANNLVLYMNAGTTVGRILSALIAVKTGPINNIIFSYTVCAILFPVVMLCVKSMAGYIALAVIYGALVSSYISVTPLAFTNIFGTHAVTTAMGIMNMWCSIGVLIGNPSQGAIYQRFDRPHDSFTAITTWGLIGLAGAVVSYISLKLFVIRDSGKGVLSRT